MRQPTSWGNPSRSEERSEIGPVKQPIYAPLANLLNKTGSLTRPKDASRTLSHLRDKTRTFRKKGEWSTIARTLLKREERVSWLKSSTVRAWLFVDRSRMIRMSSPASLTWDACS